MSGGEGDVVMVGKFVLRESTNYELTVNLLFLKNSLLSKFYKLEYLSRNIRMPKILFYSALSISKTKKHGMNSK